MAGYSMDNSRVKGTVITKQIIFGNKSSYFGKKRESDGHTHSWTCYFKSFDNEDMSSYIKKVQFKLHESYANPTRVLSKPPYEVNETGWGEFEIQIKVYFMDPVERPVTLYHLLKLFQTEAALASGKKNLVSEYYDEIIFQDPTQMMHQCLLSARQLPFSKQDTDWAEKERKTLDSIANARQKISHEISELHERLKASKDAIQHFQKEIQKVEKEQDDLTPSTSTANTT
ncbi:YEATS domain-containing protein 4-like [Dendronephthya gigantea]|uniref:YEATS domain-containing protein 4-like n=1 Tax=Dendronephthya gigantea TaxID=151771 RepID=UPI00106BE63D|nr:YEATS domain-containing protein 4-like [Dendronephthya gigantea]